MDAGKGNSTFNLPYNQSAHYWLAVFPADDNAALHAALLACGMKAIAGGYLVRVVQPWDATWKKVRETLAGYKADERTEAALIPGGAEPGGQEITLARKPLKLLDTLAASLWLGSAMIEDKIVCYMQPVLDKRGKVFGYESFARVEDAKELIGGGKIIAAGRSLQAEYILDRYLHVKAIGAFISSDLEGFLFVNFVPGFIHRPEKYLEGLTDAARIQGMPAKQLVLDFTQSEAPRDLSQLKAIFDYCRSKGYSLSLDDISSPVAARKILDAIRPDFIKLDIALVRGAESLAQYRAITDLVQLAHGAGATVLAEGVETESVHRELLKAGVDLFQGYLFSPPVAVSRLKKAAG